MWKRIIPTNVSTPLSQLICASFQKRNARVTMIGIADAGKDQGRTAMTHSLKGCFAMVLSVNVNHANIVK
jgi:hypothetical protein